MIGGRLNGNTSASSIVANLPRRAGHERKGALLGAVRSSNGFSWTKRKALFGSVTLSRKSRPITAVVLSTPGVSRQNFVDLLHDRGGAADRGGVGKLDIDVEGALVLLGQKACRGALHEQVGRATDPRQDHEGDEGDADQTLDQRGVTVASVVDALEDVADRAPRAVPGLRSTEQSAGLKVSALRRRDEHRPQSPRPRTG